jgi:hypothetical protein
LAFIIKHIIRNAFLSVADFFCIEKKKVLYLTLSKIHIYLDIMDKENKLEISLPEALSMGVYSNATGINNSPTEFVMDFLNIMPGVPKATVVSRIVMTPSTAKRLLMVLAENIEGYEKLYGPITDPELSMLRPTGEAS